MACKRQPFIRLYLQKIWFKFSESVTDFWGWGAHRAQLCCPNYVSDDVCERGVPEEALNLCSTSYPDHGRCGDLPLQGKIPTAEPGVEPGTTWLWPPSHEAGLLSYNNTFISNFHRIPNIVFFASGWIPGFWILYANVYVHRLWRWNRPTVPKRWHIQGYS
jgi:hypothetical protein